MFQPRQAACVQHPPALGSCAGAQVDDPVGGADHVRVVLDDDDRRARPHEAIEDDEQPGDVLGVQARRWLVEHEQPLPERPPPQVLGQLDPLGLAA